MFILYIKYINWPWRMLYVCHRILDILTLLLKLDNKNNSYKNPQALRELHTNRFQSTFLRILCLVSALMHILNQQRLPRSSSGQLLIGSLNRNHLLHHLLSQPVFPQH